MVQVWISMGKFFKSIGQERVRVSLRHKDKRTPRWREGEEKEKPEGKGGSRKRQWIQWWLWSFFIFVLPLKKPLQNTVPFVLFYSKMPIVVDRENPIHKDGNIYFILFFLMVWSSSCVPMYRLLASWLVGHYWYCNLRIRYWYQSDIFFSPLAYCRLPLLRW